MVEYPWLFDQNGRAYISTTATTTAVLVWGLSGVRGLRPIA